MTDKQYWLGVTVRALLVALIIYVGYHLTLFAYPLIYPFVIGLIISLMIEPIVKRLERRFRIPRWLSVVLILFLLLAVVLSFMIFLIAEIVVELTHLADSLPEIFKQLQIMFMNMFTQENENMKKIFDTLQNYLKKNPQHQEKIEDSLSNNLGLIADKGTQIITGFLTGLGTFLSDLPFFLTVLVFVFLAAFFISLDFPRLKLILIESIPGRVHKTGSIVLTDIKKALIGFLRAQLILISITAIIMFSGLLILDIQYAITIALLIGVVDLLPYLGVGAVMVPWIIYTLFIGNFQLALGLGIIYGVILVVRQILEPKLLASTVGLDPLLTLIAIFVGLQLLGFVGIIIGPIVVVILLALQRAHVFRDTWNFICGNKKVRTD